MRNDRHISPVHSAARKGNAEICRLLLEYSETEGISTLEGPCLPLNLACMSGSRDVCELLLSYGADIASKTMSPYTALHVACFQGNKELCELFIKEGNILYVFFFIYII